MLLKVNMLQNILKLWKLYNNIEKGLNNVAKCWNMS